MNRLKVSVVMPCLNEEEFTREAVESLVDDYFRVNCELIAVDSRTQAHGLNIGIKEAQGGSCWPERLFWDSGGSGYRQSFTPRERPYVFGKGDFPISGW